MDNLSAAGPIRPGNGKGEACSERIKPWIFRLSWAG